MASDIGVLSNVMNESKNNIKITRFYGGEKNGICVQLTN